MEQARLAFQKLVSHEFTKHGLNQGVAVVQKLQTGSFANAQVEYVRDPDEYEFYLIEVGQTLSQLLSLCDQLTQTTVFLSAFSPTKRMKEVGITRASQIQYNIENFLIRTQSLHDRVLKLVNAVFHLGLDLRDCRHDTIVKNLHVKVTVVPTNLQRIRKLLGKYQQERNMVVHHAGYVENDLRKLQLFHLVQNHSDDIEQEMFLNSTRYLTRKIVTQKIEEFSHYNEAVFLELALLFDELISKYNQMVSALSLKCGHSHSS